MHAYSTTFFVVVVCLLFSELMDKMFYINLQTELRDCITTVIFSERNNTMFTNKIKIINAAAHSFLPECKLT